MRQAYGQKQQRQTDHRRELARAAAPFEGVPLARRRPQARSVLECMRIIAAYPGTWEVGAALAAAAPPGTGAYYPREMDLVYGMSRAAYRSCRQVDAEWAEPTQWRYLQGLVRSADVTLRSEPYDFHHLRGFMDRHFDPDVQAALRDAFRRAAQALRIPLGLVLDSRELNWFAPDARNAVLGDGTYVRPLSGVYIDAESGVVKGTRARYQPRFSEGVAGTSKDGREYGGHLFVFLHARGPAYMQRVVLDVVQARPGVGEIITAMGAFGRIHDELGSAIHAFVYDKALSGRHFVDVMHHGVMPVTKLAHDGDKYDRGFVLAGLDDVQQKMTRKRLAVFPFGSCEHAVAAFNGGAWEIDRPRRARDAARTPRTRRD